MSIFLTRKHLYKRHKSIGASRMLICHFKPTIQRWIKLTKSIDPDAKIYFVEQEPGLRGTGTYTALVR